MEIMLQIDEPFQSQLDLEPLEEALRLTLQLVNQNSSSETVNPNAVTVVVTDNDTVQQLNAQYRGIDAPTDVLSFENVPDPDFPQVDEAEADHLGDIIIAYPVAETQASVAGHPTQNEVILLAVHGLLHLLGYDHDNSDSKQKMWLAQHQIMAQLGLGHVQPTES